LLVAAAVWLFIIDSMTRSSARAEGRDGSAQRRSWKQQQPERGASSASFYPSSFLLRFSSSPNNIIFFFAHRHYLLFVVVVVESPLLAGCPSPFASALALAILLKTNNPITHTVVVVLLP